MPHNRYFVPQSFSENVIQIEGSELHHLRTVCRNKPGDSIEMIDGKGSLGLGRVRSLSKESATVELLSLESKPRPDFVLTLFLALLKPSHLEYAIEKATEVGAMRFELFVADLSEKKAVSAQYQERLHTIILNATKQCGRLFLPELHIHESLFHESLFHKSLPADFADCQLFFGDLDPEAQSLESLSLTRNVGLVVGPESGFSKYERAKLLEMNASPLSLHPYTLRAETAAVAGTLLLFNKLYR